MTSKTPANDDAIDIRFSHVQLYVDDLRPLDEYKELEERCRRSPPDRGCVSNLAPFAQTSRSQRGDAASDECAEIMGKKKKEETTTTTTTRAQPHAPSFETHGRDVVRQLIAGFGFRVTGVVRASGNDEGTTDDDAGTTSVLVTSSDPNGIQLLVTSRTVATDGDNDDDGGDDNGSQDEDDGEERGRPLRYRHFDAANVDRFYDVHSGRQGIAVLAFEVGPGLLSQIHERYSSCHPRLLPGEYARGPMTYHLEDDDVGACSVLEAFAYYRGEDGARVGVEGGDDASRSPDEGTRLRFLEPSGGSRVEEEGREHGRRRRCALLPGIVAVPAEFQSDCRPAYFDHWVSNVVSRTGFLETLEDVLSFTPKVDFNAGVVAAGEAQIESTVTGNRSTARTEDKVAALRDRSQIYLPINNAITEIGHVHGFLKEIGQGVQHVASRVENIIEFVQQANDRRKSFGEGFTFLNIPRSYYGILTEGMLVKGPPQHKEDNLSSSTKELLSPQCANAVYGICVSEGLLNVDRSLRLDKPEHAIKESLDSKIPAWHREEYYSNREGVLETILHSRYANLYNLLQDHLSKESYVAIVRNQILVDVQGEDLLFQIFTSNVLQRNSGEEAPFFEFIQRVCSERIGADGRPKRLRPGCGGFGIRNFLTLFLSIEVTKAMLEASHANESGCTATLAFAQRRVELFTQQLNESNPLLTKISDAMTREGAARDKMRAPPSSSCQDEKKEDCGKWAAAVERESLAKARANERLMECNLKYRKLMKELRESLESTK